MFKSDGNLETVRKNPLTREKEERTIRKKRYRNRCKNVTENQLSTGDGKGDTDHSKRGKAKAFVAVLLRTVQ